MALSYAVRRQLLETSLPESTEVRLELQDYLARTGMTPPDFARRINYARETVYQFLNGHYSRISSNDGLIRTAIRDFIAAHPIATPAISSGKLYETENARLLRRYFYEALDHGRAYYLYGAPGTQKTYVLQHLIAELNRLSRAE
jgi:DNA transposition AAA+ family ATPase